MAGRCIPFSPDGGARDSRIPRDATAPADAAPALDAPALDANRETFNIAFVTSTKHAPLDLTIEAADEVCNSLARGAGLDGDFVAWLSTAEVDARDRLSGARGWMRPDGEPFADTVADLIAGAVLHPLRLDEHGNDVGQDEVATATMADGRGFRTCDWPINDPPETLFGVSAATTGRWTDSLQVTVSCMQPLRLYCFGVDKSAPLVVRPASGRRAFVTSLPFAVEGGREGADRHCAESAGAAGIQGEFRSFLSTTGDGAISRFDLEGPTWVRLDGVPIAETPLHFVTGQILAPLNVTEVGTYTCPTVWTGAPLDRPSTAAHTCANWRERGTSGWLGHACHTDTKAIAHGPDHCSVGRSIYCLEL